MARKLRVKDHGRDDEQERDVVAVENATAGQQLAAQFAFLALAEDGRDQVDGRQVAEIDPLRVRMLLYIVLAEHVLLNEHLKVILVTRIDKSWQ